VDGRYSWRATAQIPNSACNLHDVADQDLAPGITAAAAAQSAAQAYAATASAQATIATTKAGEASDNADAAAAAATVATIAAGTASPDPVVVGESRSLSDSDFGGVLSCTAELTLTIPAGLTAGFYCAIEQAGTGQVTFSAGEGATLRNVDGESKTASQYAVVGLVNVASETYNLVGSTGV
jgi:hypothetical protein